MKTKVVRVNSIYLDIVNPRFDAVSSQEEAAASLLGQCGAKIIKLAEDIIEYGVNPTDVMICEEAVLPSGKTVYIAKEGNRRILAIKALIDPRIVGNAKWSSRFSRLVHVAHGIGMTPKHLNVAIFSSEEHEEMKHWIIIKHNGENGGSGTVPWGSSEQARFSGSGRNSYATMVRDWLNAVASISAEEKQKINDVPITTFDRILGSAQGRVILGVSFQDGKLYATRKVENVIANLLGVVRDLTSTDPRNPRKKIINVSDVKNTEQIQQYLSKFEHEDDSLNHPVLLTQEAAEGTSGTTGGNANPDSLTSNRRANGALVSSSKAYLQRRLKEVGAVSRVGKVKQLVAEMVLMPIDKVPLAFCIVFRSLLDVSMHAFAYSNGISTEGVKLKTLASQCQGKINTLPNWSSGVPKQLVNEAVHILNRDTLFSITELNNLVHGTIQVPSYDAILAYGPRIVPFLIALNGGEPSQEA